MKEEIKIAVLEEKVNTLHDNVEKIMNNHLPHIQERLESNEKKLARWGGGLSALIIVVPLLIRYLL